MSTEATTTVGQSNGTADVNQKLDDSVAAINKLSLQEAPAVQVQSQIPPTTKEPEGIRLPLSAKDGIIKTPLGAPLTTSEPKASQKLSIEKEEKYQTLLKNVLQWTEVPVSLTKNATTAPLTDGERMFMTRDCLLRYLRADKWDVTQAATRLKNTLSWRREYGLEKLTSDYISIENETGKQLIFGWDAEGRPCQYMRPSKQNTEKSDRQIEPLVYMLERAIDLMPPGQETLTILINFAETKSGQGASLAQGKQTLYILQNHYPERLGRSLVANLPWYIWGFFKLITPFIDPMTKEKIKFNEDFGNYIPREQLLKESGGAVQFEYDHASYWPALTKLCEEKRAAYRERWEKAGKRIGESELYLRGGPEGPIAAQAQDSQTAAAAVDESANPEADSKA